MKLDLDPGSGRSTVEQIEDGIRDWIIRNGAGGGSRLPSIRRLSSELRVSRNSAIEAYERLVAQGLIRSKPGSGFYVAESANTMVATPLEPAGFEDVAGDKWSLFENNESSLKLGCGWLPVSWLEVEDLSYAIRQVTRQGSSGILDYSTPMGTLELRALIKERIRLLGVEAGIQQVLLTGGGSHALDLLVRLLLKPGDTVFVESPGYYNLIGLLKLQQVNAVGVPRLPGGPDVERMAALLKAHKPKLFFTNSVFQNPTGTTLTPTVAHRLLRLAEQYGFQVVEDDIYADFQHEPSIRLAALDGLRRVIYLGSFSKSLSSSLRVGFIAAEPSLIKPLVDIKMLTSISASRFSEQVVMTMLQNGSYRKLVERLRVKLSAQMASALNLLRRAGWEVYAEPAGGMFIWARYPGVSDSQRLVERAWQSGISLSAGQAFVPEDTASPWLRINVAYTRDRRAIRFLNDPQGI